MNNFLLERESRMKELVADDNVMDIAIANLDSGRLAAFKKKLVSLSTERNLMKCTPEAILIASFDAVRLGLPLMAGQGYIVPYKNKATLDVGYKGWQMLANRSGINILADVVTSVDTFEEKGYGHKKEIVFIPNNEERDTSNDSWLAKNYTGVIVSVLEVEGNVHYSKFVDRKKVEKIAGMSPSRSKTNSPYRKWFEEMLKGKAIKSVASKVSLDASSPISKAIEVLNSYEQEKSKENNKTKIDDERFYQLLGVWGQRVKDKRNTTAQIISSVSQERILTPSQIQQIIDLDNNKQDDCNHKNKEEA